MFTNGAEVERLVVTGPTTMTLEGLAPPAQPEMQITLYGELPIVTAIGEVRSVGGLMIVVSVACASAIAGASKETRRAKILTIALP